jgi:hypothetical protein
MDIRIYGWTAGSTHGWSQICHLAFRRPGKAQRAPHGSLFASLGAPDLCHNIRPPRAHTLISTHCTARDAETSTSIGSVVFTILVAVGIILFVA